MWEIYRQIYAPRIFKIYSINLAKWLLSIWRIAEGRRLHLSNSRIHGKCCIIIEFWIFVRFCSPKIDFIVHDGLLSRRILIPRWFLGFCLVRQKKKLSVWITFSFHCSYLHKHIRRVSVHVWRWICWANKKRIIIIGLIDNAACVQCACVSVNVCVRAYCVRLRCKCAKRVFLLNTRAGHTFRTVFQHYGKSCWEAPNSVCVCVAI